MVYVPESVCVVNKTNCRHSLSDVFDDVIHLLDCIEDSKNADELLRGINKLSHFRWSLDRETPTKIRFVAQVGLNLRYLKIDKTVETK